MIREARIDEVRAVTEFMTRFESCTEHVKVDVDHATKNYERFIREGRGAIRRILESGKEPTGDGLLTGVRDGGDPTPKNERAHRLVVQVEIEDRIGPALCIVDADDFLHEVGEV